MTEIKLTPTQRELALRIAGEIVFADNVGQALRSWRQRFMISTTELAHYLGVSPSVISDYESGRRKSPGTGFIKKVVSALVKIDNERGGRVTEPLRRLYAGSEALREAIIDMRDFVEPISIGEFCKRIKAELVVGEGAEFKPLLGYTVVDSIKLILDVPSSDYPKLYGSTSQRAAIFVKVSTGRSPLVALKAMQAGLGSLKPGLIALHGAKTVDKLAIIIAKNEDVPLALLKVQTQQELINLLKSIRPGEALLPPA
ncbi:MAG: helix-turn-helix domain-containing protein [Candidatus Nezhaarchaeota archaeon]|nr:helix-turn-helix domain-containing protein [Candidatus Nezhaarchaeota archaeon]MCX8141486.1 helix-turn-helix domain-containing protein [Candidatus Nezhaarchaeota archaeon]MDW8049752.1 helix-turn-helix domain-containing protein [Nitrososphaerota archaeon]